MSTLYPFAALRPTPEAAAAVAAVPYDVVTTEEARALAKDNPLSFLHVSRAEIDLPPSIDPYADEVYDKATANFAELRRRAPLVVEAEPSLYVYQLHMGGHVQTGVAGCFSLDEYDTDRIKKHEKTRPDKEDDRTRHMIAIGAQTGPVFLTYKAAASIDAVVDEVTGSRPLFDFVAPDGIRHVIWRVTGDPSRAMIDGFATLSDLYIADGHHRAASAARTRRAMINRGPGEHNRVLAVAFPDRQMQILPYNRVIRDLGGRSPDAFLDALRGQVAVREGGAPQPSRKGEAALYLAGRWYTLAFRETPTADAAAALDVSRLQDDVLAPLVGITDVRTDKRIDFVGGVRGVEALERMVDDGRFAAAFSMYPVTVADLMRIADAGGIMPPKSTWFEPKLRDGLLSHVIA